MQREASHLHKHRGKKQHLQDIPFFPDGNIVFSERAFSKCIFTSAQHCYVTVTRPDQAHDFR